MEYHIGIDPKKLMKIPTNFSPIILSCIKPKLEIKHDFKFWQLVNNIKGMNVLQSKCFFLGPMSSSVVALQTALAKPCPANECLAANIRSLMVCPVFIMIGQGTQRFANN